MRISVSPCPAWGAGITPVVFWLSLTSAHESRVLLGAPPVRGGFAGDLGVFLRGEPVGTNSTALEPAGAPPRRALGSRGLLGLADGLLDDLVCELVGIAQALGLASEHGVGQCQERPRWSNPGWISN